MERRRKQSIHWISSDDSLEFAYFSWCLTHSSIIALDAEWKPVRSRQLTFPTVCLLQIACRISNCDSDSGSPVFLLDLPSIHFLSIYQVLNGALTSPYILKLGFRFKQDFVYLSSTFCSDGCDPGFDRVEPFIDIMSLYDYLQPKESVGNKVSKQSKSLALICKELLGIELSKELQCSDWSLRPLSQEQKEYAAADAQCLLAIFDVFKGRTQDIGQAFIESIESEMMLGSTKQMDVHLKHLIRKYGDKILLQDSDRKPKGPKIHKKRAKKHDAGIAHKQRQLASSDGWQGPPPWDLSLGSDGCPKFLCDVMVEGLAKHLRCVGIDAATPHSKKPDARDLIEHAYKEKRVILTRDAKLLKHGYLIKNQIYRVKNLLKNEQLLEVIESFQLKICADQLMSRCTKCNGKFIQKPLTTEEALEAAKGFQVIPNCLFNKNLEFWQCMDCNQLYWEGTQYHNALQKFIDVCKINQ